MNIIYELNKISIYHPQESVRSAAEVYISKIDNNITIDRFEVKEFIEWSYENWLNA